MDVGFMDVAAEYLSQPSEPELDAESDRDAYAACVREPSLANVATVAKAVVALLDPLPLLRAAAPLPSTFAVVSRLRDNMQSRISLCRRKVAMLGQSKEAAFLSNVIDDVQAHDPWERIALLVLIADFLDQRHNSLELRRYTYPHIDDPDRILALALSLDVGTSEAAWLAVRQEGERLMGAYKGKRWQGGLFITPQCAGFRNHIVERHKDWYVRAIKEREKGGGGGAVTSAGGTIDADGDVVLVMGVTQGLGCNSAATSTRASKSRNTSFVGMDGSTEENVHDSPQSCVDRTKDHAPLTRGASLRSSTATIPGAYPSKNPGISSTLASGKSIMNSVNPEGFFSSGSATPRQEKLDAKDAAGYAAMKRHSSNRNPIKIPIDSGTGTNYIQGDTLPSFTKRTLVHVAAHTEPSCQQLPANSIDRDRTPSTVSPHFQIQTPLSSAGGHASKPQNPHSHEPTSHHYSKPHNSPSFHQQHAITDGRQHAPADNQSRLKSSYVPNVQSHRHNSVNQNSNGPYPHRNGQTREPYQSPLPNHRPQSLEQTHRHQSQNEYQDNHHLDLSFQTGNNRNQPSWLTLPYPDQQHNQTYQTSTSQHPQVGFHYKQSTDTQPHQLELPEFHVAYTSDFIHAQSRHGYLNNEVFNAQPQNADAFRATYFVDAQFSGLCQSSVMSSLRPLGPPPSAPGYLRPASPSRLQGFLGAATSLAQTVLDRLIGDGVSSVYDKNEEARWAPEERFVGHAVKRVRIQLEPEHLRDATHAVEPVTKYRDGDDNSWKKHSRVSGADLYTPLIPCDMCQERHRVPDFPYCEICVKVSHVKKFVHDAVAGVHGDDVGGLATLHPRQGEVLSVSSGSGKLVSEDAVIVLD
ncbi:hypothetical protein BC830DRAFT_1079278 [Chytriomyces sp. MP71]|nr:hypothetical protein BC830DRAFT_1079278 [Chytriomyces sp. MP71]